MADVSFVAMAAVTAADHERISKFCLDRLWGMLSQSQRYLGFRHWVQPPTVMGAQSLGMQRQQCESEESELPTANEMSGRLA